MVKLGHLRIDGHEFSVNQLYSWIGGLITLYRNGKLQKVKLHPDLENILSNVEICKNENIDKQHNDWWNILNWLHHYEKIRESIERKAADFIKNVEAETLFYENKNKEKLRGQTSDENLEAQEKLIREMRDAREGKRHHTTLYLYRKEFERYEDNIKRKPQPTIPWEHHVKEKFAEFLNRHGLYNKDEKDTADKDGESPEPEMTEQDTPETVNETPGTIDETESSADDKSQPSNQNADKDLSNAILAFLQNNPDYMNEFINIVKEGMTELALERFN